MSNPYAPPTSSSPAVQRRGYYFAIFACYVCAWWVADRREGYAGTWIEIAIAVALFVVEIGRRARTVALRANAGSLEIGKPGGEFRPVSAAELVVVEPSLWVTLVLALVLLASGRQMGTLFLYYRTRMVATMMFAMMSMALWQRFAWRRVRIGNERYGRWFARKHLEELGVIALAKAREAAAAEAPPSHDTRSAGDEGIQLVGQTCAECGDRIVMESNGKLCGDCGVALHTKGCDRHHAAIAHS